MPAAADIKDVEADTEPRSVIVRMAEAMVNHMANPPAISLWDDRTPANRAVFIEAMMSAVKAMPDSTPNYPNTGALREAVQELLYDHRRSTEIVERGS